MHNRHHPECLLIRILAGICFATAITPTALAGQSGEADMRREVFTIDASYGRTYDLHVLLPADHDASDEPLDVLYYLDAWWWREIVEGTYRLLHLSSPARVRPLALVGISTSGDVDDWNRQRNRDFTPTPYRPPVPGVTLRTGGVVVDSAGTGGAPAFLEFLEEAVIPRVEQQFNLEARGRGLIGHSFGGLFATWVSLVRPDLFGKLVVISPATYWNSFEIMSLGNNSGREPVGVNAHETVSVPDAVVVVGGRELGGMRRSADSAAVALRNNRPGGVETEIVAGADHTTVILHAVLMALSRLYSSGR